MSYTRLVLWSFVIYKNTSINYFRILKHLFCIKSLYHAEEVHFYMENKMIPFYL